MAATFVVETGTGSATANSYVSVADADQYFDNYGAPTTWTGATTASKEEALRAGTQYFEVEYRERWLGNKASSTQALAWPRAYVYIDSYLLDESAMPQALLDATCEAALAYLTDGDLLPDITNPSAIKRKRLKAGEAEIDTEYADPGQSQVKFYRKAETMVRGLVLDGSAIIRV